MRVSMIKFLLDGGHCILWVGVPLSYGVTNCHNTGPIWLQQKLTCCLLKQPVECGIGSAKHFFNFVFICNIKYLVSSQVTTV